MRLEGEQELLRVFIGEQDKWEGLPLYEAIVKEARRRGMAGATVIKAFMGFGGKSNLHTANILRLSEDLPIVVEIVDTKEKVAALLPKLDEMVSEGLITLEKVHVIMYRSGDAKAKNAKAG